MQKLKRLKEHLAKLADGGLCVAFSGGVDSALLLKVAVLAAPGKVRAVTVSTPFHTESEMIPADDYGVPHEVLEMSLPESVLRNPPDRCYHCKLALFTRIREYADEHGLAAVLDGTNADDLGEYRPGLAALKELGVKSPLADVGLSKADVREVAAELGLAAADKPSSPCLATRFPYDTAIDLALLPRIARIEDAVKEIGVAIVRARVHGDTIRLETMPDSFAAILESREKLLKTVREEGFERLTLDLEGYRSGSFDRPLIQKG